jgi:hypothetical protein
VFCGANHCEVGWDVNRIFPFTQAQSREPGDDTYSLASARGASIAHEKAPKATKNGLKNNQNEAVR